MIPAKARREIEVFCQAQDGEGERADVARQCGGMWDLSEFMKRLKQRFAEWYNRRKGRKGTLRKGRFKSVLVEGLASHDRKQSVRPAPRTFEQTRRHQYCGKDSCRWKIMD